MTYHERISVDVLKMCSLGDLVALRKDFLGTEHIRIIDFEIYSRIPDINQLCKREQQHKRLTKKRERGIMHDYKYQRR